MRKISLFVSILIFSSVVAIGLYIATEDPTKESIIFFPLDPQATFNEAITTLSLQGNKDNDEYEVQWEVESVLNKEAYLRQDLSLLFSNGRLKAKLSEWEDNSEKIAQYTKVSGEDSSHLIATSYHYGEIHQEDEIKSSQRMSGDELYVIDSSFSTLSSFRVPETENQKEWKQVLDNTVNQQLEYSWENLKKHFNIDSNDYYSIPLVELVSYNDKPLFTMGIEKSQKTIGLLWEGLYKNYFLGIKKSDGSVVEPIGSIIPLVLLHKNYSHLFVLTETSDGEPIQLIQYIRD
ncbi:hypothetical protein PY093_10590 [Cytobacillus sp. S13-E01]|uniref:hypothetical protein n=1 Tax=Cytobacillus sp. S13-E01 TaxID=3031326 RepID=UPI0023D8362A|nr:hypothetical protein [Cytobacillus sp. S13-E01]MDF0727161.1 hypothetical protein [Cytobacillus sp. S13-E01]